jgi:hypothetical protein
MSKEKKLKLRIYRYVNLYWEFIQLTKLED